MEQVSFFQNDSTDPYFNQAFEEYIFENYKEGTILLLWRNTPAVICGNYQNIFAEINVLETMDKGVAIVRRPTGGGTVYHDLGNLNYTLIRTCEASKVEYRPFIEPIVEALNRIGVKASMNRQCDIAINGKKISGSAQKIVHDRVLHHGTLLFDTDLDRLRALANGCSSNYISKGTKSVPWPVTNIKENGSKLSMDEFTVSLYDELARIFQITPMTLPDAAITEIQEMSAAKYQSWDWTYGHSPRFEFRREFDFRGNKISISYKTVKGIIQEITLDPPDDRIRASLTGQRLKVEELRELFSRIPGYENFYKNIL